MHEAARAAVVRCGDVVRSGEVGAAAVAADGGRVLKSSNMGFDSGERCRYRDEKCL